ncbi:MAG: hypothetical protein VR65_12300 [Desulfobulbaceae bacterium BRH_c16a]|nr:MAG: hypothetical protein VR65_12300 [Desulfobulbaceae bacterium BRH_c16a]
MTKTTSLIIAFIALSLLPGTQKAWAETSYVADSFEITLRTGPNNTSKIIKMLKSDEPLEVLGEEGGWLSVRTQDGDQGWAFKRFISQDLPKSIQLQKLTERNEQLSALSGGASDQLDALDKENSSLKETLANIQEEHQQLKEKYTTLESDAANVLVLKNKYSDTEEMLTKANTELETFSKENEELRASSNLKWFLSGAGVISVAWITGYLMGLSRRRQKSSRLV